MHKSFGHAGRWIGLITLIACTKVGQLPTLACTAIAAYTDHEIVHMKLVYQGRMIRSCGSNPDQANGTLSKIEKFSF